MGKAAPARQPVPTPRAAPQLAPCPKLSGPGCHLRHRAARPLALFGSPFVAPTAAPCPALRPILVAGYGPSYFFLSPSTLRLRGRAGLRAEWEHQARYYPAAASQVPCLRIRGDEATAHFTGLVWIRNKLTRPLRRGRHTTDTPTTAVPCAPPSSRCPLPEGGGHGQARGTLPGLSWHKRTATGRKQHGAPPPSRLCAL